MTRPSRTRTRALGVALLSLVLVLPAGVAAADTTPTDDPAEVAAGWLAAALEDGLAVSEFGPSTGVSIDALFALAAVGVAADVQAQIVGSVTADVGPYTRGEGFDADDAAYAGATAKLALGLLVAGENPRDAGGTDLIAQLLAREITDADDGIVGRFADTGDFGDFSTPLTQSLALLALTRAEGVNTTDDQVAALRASACPDGGFPNSFDAAQEPDSCSSSADTTGFAVQALLAVGETAAAQEAVSWLTATQAADGSFASGDGVNVNSTGLAAAAFTLVGQDAAAQAANAWILGVQAGCDSDQPGAIPFNAEEDGFVELATAQALLGLTGANLATLSSAGSTSTVPALDCADDVDETDPEPTPAPAEDQQDGTDTDPATVDDVDADREIPQPTVVDSGLSPSGGIGSLGLVVVLMLLGGGLLAVGARTSRPGPLRR